MIDSSPFGARQSRYVEHLPDDTLAVVSRGSDIRWLTGFTGSNGLLLIRPGASTLLTDGRYREQASREAFVMEIRIVHGDLIGAVSGVVDDGRATDSEPALRRVVFQADDLSFEQVVGLQQSLADHRPEFAAIGDSLSSLRSVKDRGELDTIGRALAISEGVMEEIHELLQPGVSERTVAAEIDYRHRLRGADGAAFDTIVAFGERAALPHARPGESRLAPGDCILIDFGCVVDGYRSDITRTMVLGEPPSGFIEAYRAVEKALQSAQDAAKAGMDGRDLDSVARTALATEGLADHFSHSLGHGVGLDIHEHPRVSSVVSSRIEHGAVITIEPGVYLPGRFGIRIENMVHVERTGARVLNTLETKLVML